MSDKQHPTLTHLASDLDKLAAETVETRSMVESTFGLVLQVYPIPIDSPDDPPETLRCSSELARKLEQCMQAISKELSKLRNICDRADLGE